MGLSKPVPMMFSIIIFMPPLPAGSFLATAEYQDASGLSLLAQKVQILSERFLLSDYIISGFQAASTWPAAT